MEDQRRFTGVERRRKTSWKVLAGDRAARALITLGGLGTIAAVGLVCVFLVWVVVPLFLPASFAPLPSADRAAADGGRRPAAVRVDEYGTLRWTLFEDGSVDLFRADTGERLDTVRPAPGEEPTAVALTGAEGRIAFGYADGRVRLGRIRIAAGRLVVDGEPPADVGGGRPVVRLDLTLRSGEPRLLALTDDGVLHLREVAKTVNLLTKEETFEL